MPPPGTCGISSCEFFRLGEKVGCLSDLAVPRSGSGKTCCSKNLPHLGSCANAAATCSSRSSWELEIEAKTKGADWLSRRSSRN